MCVRVHWRHWVSQEVVSWRKFGLKRGRSVRNCGTEMATGSLNEVGLGFPLLFCWRVIFAPMFSVYFAGPHTIWKEEVCLEDALHLHAWLWCGLWTHGNSGSHFSSQVCREAGLLSMIQTIAFCDTLPLPRTWWCNWVHLLTALCSHEAGLKGFIEELFAAFVHSQWSLLDYFQWLGVRNCQD